MISRQGSRPITVDGHSLRWWVRRRGKRGCYHCDRITVVVAHESRTGQIVRASLADDAWHTEKTPITPARMAALIQQALALGWTPGQGTGAIDLPYDLEHGAAPSPV